jgi:hypothetical protein
MQSGNAAEPYDRLDAADRRDPDAFAVGDLGPAGELRGLFFVCCLYSVDVIKSAN